jgi:hypothetical protein
MENESLAIISSEVAIARKKHAESLRQGFSYDAAAVSKLLGVGTARNFTLEKTKIKRDLNVAIANGNEQEISKLNKMLDQVRSFPPHPLILSYLSLPDHIITFS